MGILDACGRLLMLRRAPSLRTCPGAWGLLGEHQIEGEDAKGMARRALEEELGSEFLAVVAKSQPLLPRPIWYTADYGSRFDRQAIWVWQVTLNVTGDLAPLSPDDEVTEIRWIPPSELAPWVAQRPADFCHASREQLVQIFSKHLPSVTGPAWVLHAIVAASA